MLTNLRYVSELAEMKETFINHLLHLSPQLNTPAPGTSSGDSKSYDEYLRPRHSESFGILSAAYQLPEDLQMCLEVLGGELLEGHVRLNEALKKRYDEQYPLVRSLADVFIRNVRFCCCRPLTITQSCPLPVRNSDRLRQIHTSPRAGPGTGR